MDEKHIEQHVDDFINDIISEKRPRYYHNNKSDPELEKMFETVRAVKRLRLQSTAARIVKSGWFKGIIAAAAVLILVLGFNLAAPGGPEHTGIVHAVVRAYEGLQGYSGVVEIRSEKNGAVDYLEVIEIDYQKPWKYRAYHRYDGYEMQYMSDGERLAVIDHRGVTIENVFPEKELWRYHIGTAVWELEEAGEVNILGREVLFGRDAIVLEYRFEEEDVLFNQLWIDEEYNLPLRKVLNHPEGRRLVVEFKELQVNPSIKENAFSLELPEGVPVNELNRTGTLQELQDEWAEEVDTLTDGIPPGLKLLKVGLLEDDFFEYVLRFRGEREKEFLDVYFSDSPMEFYYLPGSELGRLAAGYVELNSSARNVFERYIGDHKIAKWVLDESEIFMVGSLDISILRQILENMAGERIEYADQRQLEKEGIKPPIEKEGH